MRLGSVGRPGGLGYLGHSRHRRRLEPSCGAEHADPRPLERARVQLQPTCCFFEEGEVDARRWPRAGGGGGCLVRDEAGELRKGARHVAVAIFGQGVSEEAVRGEQRCAEVDAARAKSEEVDHGGHAACRVVQSSEFILA